MQLPSTWKRVRDDQARTTREQARIRKVVRARVARRRSGVPVPVLDHPESAKVAGLRYVNDETTEGIRRVGSKARFKYLKPNGRPLTDTSDLQRIASLRIPPAWTEVWICPWADGHLQATGRDARGRKQYRYHPRWHEVRDEVKYGRLIAFAEALPLIRRRTDQDLRRSGLPREKVLAAVVQLLEKTLIRVGNEEYARQNGSFGLTTMKDGHARIEGAKVRFSFRGKHGIQHAIDLQDARLARIVKACRDLPGYELFQYVDDDGQTQSIGSADVNEYLRSVTGEDFTAKDFRTWAGTVLAAQALASCEQCSSKAHAKRNVVQAVESVARKLGNTRAVCRRCYIHPAILDAYMDGATISTLQSRMQATRRGTLGAEERAVVDTIAARLGKTA